MSRRYAIFETLGTNLSTAQGGEVLAIDAASQTIARSARGSLGVTGDVHYIEFMVWGETDALTNRASVGIITGSASLAAYVGGDAYGIGYRLAEGQIHQGGSSIASVTVAAKGDVVGVLLDLESDTPSVTFFLNGVQVHNEPLTETVLAGETWYPGGSLGSDAAADLQMFLNTGQREFEHPTSLSEGWYDEPSTIPTQWIGTHDTTTHPSDTPANQRIDGAVPMQGSSLAITRSLAFPTWGDRSFARPSVGTLTIINTGDYDDLVGDVRDLPVNAYELVKGAAFSTAVDVGRFVVEAVEIIDDGALKLSLKDNTARLDDPLQRKLFLPDVDGSAANRPVPILRGACFSVAPPLYDAFNLRYKLNDRVLLGFGFVRTSGDKLANTGSPEDWTITDDWQGIELANEAVGKLTVDASSVGGDVPVPPTNLAPANLAAWDTSSNVTESAGVLTFGDSYTLANHYPEAYVSATGVIEAGKSYRLRVEITDKSGYFGGTGQRSKLWVQSGAPVDKYTAVTWEVIEEAGTHTVIIQNNAVGAITRDLFLVHRGTQSGSDFIKLTASMTLYEIDNTGVDSDNLLPIQLEPFLEQIMVELGGIDTSEVQLSDAAAIDTATSYAGIGYYTDQQVSIRDAIEAVLPSYNACMTQDRSGVFRVFRMLAPEGRATAGSITTSELLSDLKAKPDDAPGLTTRYVARRNEMPLDETDLAIDPDPLTGIPINTARALARQYQITVTTAGRLPRQYPHARNAVPMETRFTAEADAQAEVDRIRAIYATQRWFYIAEVPFETSVQYDLDQVWSLVYPRYGLSDGKNVTVVAITEDRINRKATLTLWG